MWNPSPMGSGGLTGGGVPMGGALGDGAGGVPMGGALGGGAGGGFTAPMGVGPPGASGSMMMGGSMGTGGGGPMSMGGGSTGGPSIGVPRPQQQGLQPRGQGRAKVRTMGPCSVPPYTTSLQPHACTLLSNSHLAAPAGDDRCTTTSRMMSTSLRCSRCRHRSPVASTPLLYAVVVVACPPPAVRSH